MPALLNAPITIAGTYTGNPFQIRQSPNYQGGPMAVTAQHNFTWGSGGTSVDTYLQTSLDGGATWADVIHFPQALLASARSVANVSSAVSPATPVTATDAGALAANTINPGIVGAWWRVKYVVVGTYAGGTTLRVDVNPVMVPAGPGSFN
jgi:hypothetical protein